MQADEWDELNERLELAVELLERAAKIHADGTRYSADWWKQWRAELTAHVSAAQVAAADLQLLADVG